MNRLKLLLCLPLAAIFLALPARAQLLNLEQIVYVGQPSPLPQSGLRIAALSNIPRVETGRELPRRLPKTAAIAASGEVFFLATLQDSYARQGIFFSNGSEIRPILLAGKKIEGSIPVRFASFKELALGNDGALAFVATLEGEPSREGVFVLNGTGIQTIALQNDAVPGFPSQKFQSFRIPLCPVTDSIVFLAAMDRTETLQAIFHYSAGRLRMMVSTGQRIPGNSNVQFAGIEDIAAGPDSTFLFSAPLVGGQSPAGIFQVESGASFLNGPVSTILLAGSTATSSAGAPFVSFGLLAIMDRNRYAFSGRLSNGQDGVFLLLNGSLRTISLEGYAMPGFLNQQFFTYNSIEASSRGDVLFRGVATTTAPEAPEPQGLYIYEPGTRLVLPVAVSDSPAPGMGGQRIVSVASPVLGPGGRGLYTAVVESNLLGEVMPPRIDSVLFQIEAARSQPIASTGQVSSEEGPAAIVSVPGFAQLSADTVAFSCTSLGARNGLIAGRLGRLTTLITEGQASTPRQTGEFEEFGRVAVDDAQRLFFAARTRGGDSPGGLYRFVPGGISPILLLNHSIPGSTSKRLDRIHAVSVDRAGNVAMSGAVEEAGRVMPVVLAQDAETTVIIAQEDQLAPGTSGQRFRYFQQVANSGREFLAFVARSYLPPPLPEERVGLYHFNGGKIQPVAFIGDPAPGIPLAVIREFRELSINQRGDLLFTTVVSRQDSPDVNRVSALYLFAGSKLVLLLGALDPARARQEVISDPQSPLLYDDGSYTIQARVGGAMTIVLQRSDQYLPLVSEQHTAPGLGGRLLGRLLPWPALLTSSGAFSFSALLDNAPSILLARPPFRPSVPNPSFEIMALSGLPEDWETCWTNNGSGEAYLDDTHGRYAFEGNSALRLHAGPGGGSVFVLSSLIPVESDQAYEVSARLRYSLSQREDEVYFSAIEMDAAGWIVAEHHFFGRPGDNFWQWREHALGFATTPRTKGIRLRFGISVSTEAYLDVDTVK